MPQENPLQPVRFVVDAMLGNVARDLRLLGLDAAYAGERSDAAVLRLCQTSRRALVTRDEGLAARAMNIPCILVREASPPRQVLEVLRALGLERVDLRPFTRCIRCNGPLRLLSRREARDLVPDHVAHSGGPHHGCASCGRTYWPGTHLTHLESRVRGIAEALQAPPRPV